jgi:DNA-binding IclR family transcriptional regulator
VSTREAFLRAEKPGRSPANRSLERGVEILRAFRPGSGLLANGEIAERTGLSRSTVSRLTQTLVGAGLLHLDSRHRAYHLAPAVLSLAHAMRMGSDILTIAAPKMRALAEGERINVGLAAPDRDEMVYLESIRYNRRVALRNVVSGQRVPMELTSLGRAYLATLPAARRNALFAIFRQRRGAHWPSIALAIAKSIRMVEASGYCPVSWQPEVVALAAPLRTGDGTYVLNVSVFTKESVEEVAQRLAGPLLGLCRDLQGQLL